MSGTQVLLRSSQVWEQLPVRQDQLLVLLAAGPDLPGVGRGVPFGGSLPGLRGPSKGHKRTGNSCDAHTPGTAGGGHTRAPGEESASYKRLVTSIFSTHGGARRCLEAQD